MQMDEMASDSILELEIKLLVAVPAARGLPLHTGQEGPMGVLSKQTVPHRHLCWTHRELGTIPHGATHTLEELKLAA